MEFLNYRKETSERSDAQNWAKKLLIEKTELHYDSIEGCNQNSNNVVTHLMERARIDITGIGEINLANIIHSIKDIEGNDRLLRKIRFANCFGKPLTYVLYCNENENVFVFSISDLDKISLDNQYSSFKVFSDWIKEIKGWVSTKPFREDGLPQFDIILRRAGTAWPTNIDCFISTKLNIPCAILEFQNTKDYSVRSHCNNDWFLCKSIQYNDIRRWTSQEILRVQSGLGFFIITWSVNEKNLTLKKINCITIPELPFANRQIVDEYKSALSVYINRNKSQADFEKIAKKYSTFSFFYEKGLMNKRIHNPLLSIEAKTFPYIYYDLKEYIENDPMKLVNILSDSVN